MSLYSVSCIFNTNSCCKPSAFLDGLIAFYYFYFLFLIYWSHTHKKKRTPNIPFSFINFQALPVFTFANQAGLDMLETTFVALQDITLEKIFDDHGRKALYAEFPLIMQQVPPLLLEKYRNIFVIPQMWQICVHICNL